MLGTALEIPETLETPEAVAESGDGERWGLRMGVADETTARASLERLAGGEHLPPLVPLPPLMPLPLIPTLPKSGARMGLITLLISAPPLPTLVKLLGRHDCFWGVVVVQCGGAP